MDIRQLKYFLAIAEEGQITSAARKLQMAQPPLSQQLKLLEEELGVKLFERGPRSVQLTDAGMLLRERAMQLLELADSTTRELKDYVKGVSGTLSIGTVSSSAATLLQERLLEFHQLYSGVKFEIHEGNTYRIIDLLNKGIVEVGIVRTPFSSSGLECIYTTSEPMIAVMAPEYDWTGGKTEIEIDELKGQPLIVYRRFEQLITETCLANGFDPRFFCMNDDARTTLLWANAGLGVGIIPRSAYSLAANRNLVSKEIRSDSLHTRVAAIWMKDKYLSALAAKFIENFQQQ
ncbi:LysR family transcriptional regulator [Paenibacillus sp. MMS20-IR301]|uniref:LysR family transcriptional regulator n=1 Tax=Paenibacillus sp. MMS20-IR301 TaxID=2895946 RepID=UPI0028EE77AF|nr:LysR family transcriptional regulator [Paenibacillus sp. MMS20-IR301]WNS44873.1 LysR family transcriptional regulator [Paenibacillus sp. MMS20-IR301]